MQSTSAPQWARLAEPDRPTNDEALTAANGQGLRDQIGQDAGDHLQASGPAVQAALVIEGEAYMSAYMERAHAGFARPGDLASLLSFLSGSMLLGACRVIEKVLEGQHHA